MDFLQSDVLSYDIYLKQNILDSTLFFMIVLYLLRQLLAITL